MVASLKKTQHCMSKRTTCVGILAVSFSKNTAKNSHYDAEWRFLKKRVNRREVKPSYCSKPKKRTCRISMSRQDTVTIRLQLDRIGMMISSPVWMTSPDLDL